MVVHLTGMAMLLPFAAGCPGLSHERIAKNVLFLAKGLRYASYKLTEPKTNADGKQRLTAEQYHVLREKGTEPAFSGKLLHTKQEGVYRCAGCGNELFSSDTKFDSGTGWPSFDDLMSDKSVTLEEDASHGMKCVEVKCAQCGGHLGHLFNDGPTKTGKRYCINSCALEFKGKTTESNK